MSARLLLMLAAALASSGCSLMQWPPDGAGGVAEQRWAPVPQAARKTQPTRLQQVEHHMDCSVQRYDLIAAAVENTGQNTGRVAQLELVLNRAKRELAGNLVEDADRSLTRFDQQAAAMRLVMQISAPDPKACTA